MQIVLFIMLVIFINIINCIPLSSNIQSQALSRKVQKKSFWDKNMIREGLLILQGEIQAIFWQKSGCAHILLFGKLLNNTQNVL